VSYARSIYNLLGGSQLYMELGMTFCGLQPTAGLVFSKAPLKICSAATDTYRGIEVYR